MREGQTIGDYILTGFLGKGGMGEVWLGRHCITGHEVAVKGLHSYLIEDEAIIGRFRREAETLSMLQHPNIAGLVDYFEDYNGLYLIMEFVEGESLDHMIETRTGPVPEGMAIAMFRQILKGVDFAHQRGIIHRDIKPSNFLVSHDGQVKVLDFGIAKYLEDDKKMTRTGTRMGTILYMSPEQVEGRSVDSRSDIYSLGVTLHQMLTGQPPYPADSNEYDVFARIVRSPLPRASELYPGVSARMQAIIDRATAKSPSDRFQTCAQFLAALTDEGTEISLPDHPIPLGGGRRKRRFPFSRFLAWAVPVAAAMTFVLVGYTQHWSEAGGSPKKVARKFFAAVEDRDQEKAQSLAAEGCKTVVEFFLSPDFAYPPTTYQIAGETVDGNNATIAYRKGDSDDLSSMNLIKEDGKWKVSCEKENLTAPDQK